MAAETKTGGRDATGGVIPGRYAISVGHPGGETPEGFSWMGLSDVARLESGHTPSRRKDEYWNGDVPWIGIRDATGNHGKTIFDTEQHVTQAGLDNSSARLLPADTVCLSRTASVGYVVSMGVPMATSQDFVNWVCGPELNPKYLHYVLVLEQESIRRFSRGSTHQTMYYPEAKALHVMAPERREQDSIVEVLGALDDKIAANTRLAAIADELIRCHYLSQDLGDVEPRTIGDIAENVRMQIKPDEVDTDEIYVGLEHLPRRHVFLGEAGSASDVSSAKAAFQRHDVLFGKLRPYFHKVVEAPVAGICSTDILVVRSKEPMMSGFLLAAASSDSVVAQCSAMSRGTRMPRTNWRDLSDCEVLWPGAEAARILSCRITSLTESVAARYSENEKLAQTRDALLPLLMSGRVAVKDAEKVVEEVV